MNSIISSKIVVFFYFLFGNIFIIFPSIPLSDLITDSGNKSIVFEGVMRSIGVIWISFSFLIYKISSISKSLYNSLNSTFVICFLLFSCIGVIGILTKPENPLPLFLFSILNLSFSLIYFLEKNKIK